MIQPISFQTKVKPNHSSDITEKEDMQICFFPATFATIFTTPSIFVYKATIPFYRYQEKQRQLINSMINCFEKSRSSHTCYSCPSNKTPSKISTLGDIVLSFQTWLSNVTSWSVIRDLWHVELTWDSCKNVLYELFVVHATLGVWV